MRVPEPLTPGEVQRLRRWERHMIRFHAIAATLLGLGSVSGFNLGSLVIAVVGAMLLLWVHRRIRSSRVT